MDLIQGVHLYVTGAGFETEGAVLQYNTKSMLSLSTSATCYSKDFQDMSMLSPSASALSSLTAAYLAAIGPARTVRVMNCLKGAHELTFGMWLIDSMALKQLLIMSSFLSTCMYSTPVEARILEVTGPP